MRANDRFCRLANAEAAQLCRAFNAEPDRVDEVADLERPLVGGLDF